MKLGIGVSAAFHVSLQKFSNLVIFGIPTYHRFHINSHIFTKIIKYWRGDGVSTGVVR